MSIQLSVQDGLSLTISSSSRYGDNYYLDKSEMSWIIKSDRYSRGLSRW